VVADPGGQPALWSFTDYPYQRAARGDWSVAEWRDQRFWANYPDLNVDVLDAAGRSIRGRTLLENVRATYDQGILELGPGTRGLGRGLIPAPPSKEARPKLAPVPRDSDRQSPGESGSHDAAQLDGGEADAAAGAPADPVSNRRRTADAEPSDLEVGQLVRARGQQWVVTALKRSSQPVDELAPSVLPRRTMATLTSVSDDDLGEDLTVVWEVEPGREILPTSHLPEAGTGVLDDPERLGAFLDAVRWGTVASADTRTLQAPFRAGITIEAYQLEPVARALAMPRVNLLIADDVGLGKTIEAGLIAQELLLRHRARRLLVVCPASLTTKWHDEMAARFGLDFQVLNAEALKELRRSHGLEANPFSVFPRTIISLQWLRTPRVQRLLDEVLTPETRYPGFFDLMIVDEAHHCAPPAPQKARGYAVDSKQTIAVRRLGEHTNHRLFLSATPHNGYSESWQALLAMVDPQRFERGVEPDPRVVDEVVVRRLKASITDASGKPRFPPRVPKAIPVTYDADERRAHQVLARYSAARARVARGTGAKAGDLVTLLLKKRLFSSPAAFAATLDVHVQTLAKPSAGRGRTGRLEIERTNQPDLGWLDDIDEMADAEEGADGQDLAERELLDRAASFLDEPDDDEGELLAELQRWCQRHAEPADSKAKALVAELEGICRYKGQWNDERVVVFTEYVDTVEWLSGILYARGFAGERVGVLHGSTDEHRREQLKAAFQAAPHRDPIRVLLATDAAGEGIDLQNYCHRVINFDIPFNPNKLEQRIGRVDRLGQAHEVEVAHFVGAGWEDAAAGSMEADLEFLSRVAVKVARERKDLGPVNPVIAAAVEARMLGRAFATDPTVLDASPSAAALRAERDLRSRTAQSDAAKLAAQLNESVRRLHVAPANVARVVATGMALANQPVLVALGDGTYEVPQLRGGWERALEGLADPLSGERRLLAFDPEAEAGREDVVHAHLGHPLVAYCTRLLRSAIWGGSVTSSPGHRGPSEAPHRTRLAPRGWSFGCRFCPSGRGRGRWGAPARRGRPGGPRASAGTRALPSS
jgi:superfamily II DNA or RNA helicase